MITFSLQELLLVFLALALGCVVVWVFFVRQQKRAQEQELKYSRRLKETQGKLQEYIADLDNLIVMLVGIHEFGMTATGIISQEELAQSVIDAACKLIRSDSGSLMLINHDNGELAIAASKGLPGDVVQMTKMRLGEGIAGRVAQTGKSIFVEDIETDARFMRNNSAKYPSKSFISVPLRVKNRIIGVLNVNSPEKSRIFEERDVRILTLLADQAAIAQRDQAGVRLQMLRQDLCHAGVAGHRGG
jgi:GAF domain-containing protein